MIAAVAKRTTPAQTKDSVVAAQKTRLRSPTRKPIPATTKRIQRTSLHVMSGGRRTAARW
jgi:hypothetical protein